VGAGARVEDNTTVTADVVSVPHRSQTG
jgi:hypothetical protein